MEGTERPDAQSTLYSVLSQVSRFGSAPAPICAAEVAHPAGWRRLTTGRGLSLLRSHSTQVPLDSPHAKILGKRQFQATAPTSGRAAPRLFMPLLLEPP